MTPDVWAALLPLLERIAKALETPSQQGAALEAIMQGIAREQKAAQDRQFEQNVAAAAQVEQHWQKHHEQNAKARQESTAAHERIFADVEDLVRRVAALESKGEPWKP